MATNCSQNCFILDLKLFSGNNGTHVSMEQMGIGLIYGSDF